MGAKELAPIRAKQPEDGVMTFFKRLLGIYPRFGPVRPERKDGEEIQIDEDPRLLPHRSFLSFVPFQRYDPESGQVVMIDGRRAAFFDLRPADIEGRPIVTMPPAKKKSRSPYSGTTGTRSRSSVSPTPSTTGMVVPTWWDSSRH